jgi:uncharacterized membrane protein
MPNPMAIHFDINGTPNGFASPIANALLMSVFTSFIAVSLLGTSCMCSFAITHSPEFVNIPNRDYWLNEENRPKTIRRCCFFIEIIGIGTILFMLFIDIELFRVNLTVPPGKLNANVTFYATIVLLAVIVLELVRLCLAFRLPKSGSQPTGTKADDGIESSERN